MNQHEEVSARLRCFTPTGIARILFGSTLIGILAILPLSASFSAFWPADLIANISSQLMLLAFVLSIACFVIRSWRFGSAGILITIALYFALPMSPRAERVHVDEATNTLKILHFNVLSWNKQTEDVIAMIKDSQADVVSLVETSDALLSRIRDDAELKNIYPYRHLPDRAGAGFPLVLTHAEQTGLTNQRLGPAHTLVFGFRAMTLETSIGQIAVIQGDFGSPRFRSKWNHAHKMVDEFGNELLGHIKQRELPVVLVGDLNSTPSGSISRRLSELGLFRAKPKHYFVGTYPDWPWPFSVAIDDVMTSGELSIVRWRAENATGSDHRPISVEIVRVR